jgi:hypothetical protein
LAGDKADPTAGNTEPWPQTFAHDAASKPPRLPTVSFWFGPTTASWPEEFRSNWDAGYGGGAGVFFLRQRHLLLSGEIEQYVFENTTIHADQSLDSKYTSGQDYVVTLAGFQAALPSPRVFSHLLGYASVGGGVAFWSFEDAYRGEALAEPDRNGRSVYLKFGLSTDLILSPVGRLFIQAQAIHVFSSDDATGSIPFVFGVRF